MRSMIDLECGKSFHITSADSAGTIYGGGPASSLTRSALCPMTFNRINSIIFVFHRTDTDGDLVVSSWELMTYLNLSGFTIYIGPIYDLTIFSLEQVFLSRCISLRRREERITRGNHFSLTSSYLATSIQIFKFRPQDL